MMQKSRLETVMGEQVLGSFSINPIPLEEVLPVTLPSCATALLKVESQASSQEQAASSQSTPTSPKRRIVVAEPPNESRSDLEDETTSLSMVQNHQ